MEKADFLRRALSEARAAYESKPTFNPVIAVAQAALESRWGTSQLATEANNLKGVKAGTKWTGPTLDLPTKEQRPDGSEYVTVARWRKYGSWGEAFRDYGGLIERVYPHAAAVKHDARAFLEALVAKPYPKYATDTRYVEKVWSIVEQYGLREAPKSSRRLEVKQDGVLVQSWEIPVGKRFVLTLEPDGSPILDIRAD